MVFIINVFVSFGNQSIALVTGEQLDREQSGHHVIIMNAYSKSNVNEKEYTTVSITKTIPTNYFIKRLKGPSKHQIAGNMAVAYLLLYNKNV